MRLWLDDIRPAPPGWVWARTLEHAKAVVKGAILSGDPVDECSLDHDLGLHDLDPDEFDDWDKIISISYALQDTKQHTGLDFVDWLIENNCVPDVITIHSWNPEGARRMAWRLNECGYSCRVEAFKP